MSTSLPAASSSRSPRTSRSRSHRLALPNNRSQERHLPRQERIAVERSSSFPELHLDPSLQPLTEYPLPSLFRCEHGFINHCGGILLGRPSTWMSVLWSYADALMLSRISPLLASAEGKSDPRTPTGAPVQHKVTRRLPTDGRGMLGAGFRALKPRSSGYKALKPLAIKPSILWRSSPQSSGDQALKLHGDLALNTQTSQLCAALFCVASQCTR